MCGIAIYNKKRKSVFIPFPGPELLQLLEFPKWWEQAPFNHTWVSVKAVASGNLVLGAGC